MDFHNLEFRITLSFNLQIITDFAGLEFLVADLRRKQIFQIKYLYEVHVDYCMYVSLNAFVSPPRSDLRGSWAKSQRLQRMFRCKVSAAELHWRAPYSPSMCPSVLQASHSGSLSDQIKSSTYILEIFFMHGHGQTSLSKACVVILPCEVRWVLFSSSWLSMWMMSMINSSSSVWKLCLCPNDAPSGENCEM